MYNVIDVSAGTHKGLQAVRAQAPFGAMLHTTDGTNSLGYLQHGSVLDGRYASADYLVKRDGTIYKLMPHGKHSFHAGVCFWRGRTDRANYISRSLVGVEVENHDSKGQTPTDAQHKAVAGLLLVLADVYKWSPLTVYGHYALAYPMGRRSDPREFDWGYMFWLMTHGRHMVQLYGQVDAIKGDHYHG